MAPEKKDNGSVRLILGRGVSVPWQGLSGILAVVVAVTFAAGMVVGRCTTPGGIIVY
jgi:hypothetical protein